MFLFAEWLQLLVKIEDIHRVVLGFLRPLPSDWTVDFVKLMAGNLGEMKIIETKMTAEYKGASGQRGEVTG